MNDGMLRTLRRDHRDECIEILSDHVADLESAVVTYRDLLTRALTRLHQLEGDDLPGYWEKLDDDVASGRHRPPQSIIARLKHAKRKLEGEDRQLRSELRSCLRRAA